LLGNAIKFTDVGFVQISLDLSTPPKNSPEKKQALQWVKIEVQDTGVGISPQVQNTIFERFRQGNHRRCGNGLGLHLCRQIVHSHQGLIEVISQLGQGSVFTVSLPLNPQLKTIWDLSLKS
jgi:signal transduction histidine kinase